jgi:cystathionine beta-synthase
MANRLAASNPEVVILGVDPRGSILARPESLNVLEKGESGFYRVEGIGYDFVCCSPFLFRPRGVGADADVAYEQIPDVLHYSVVTRWIKSDDATSFSTARRIIKTEGLLVGGSSGAALGSALKYLKTEEGERLFGGVEGKNVVVVFADS